MVSHGICLSLSLSTSLRVNLEVHARCCIFHSFKRLSNISFVCVCVCMYVYHSFFIHSSVDGHVGCFYVLSIVNSAAVNVGVHVSYFVFWFFFYNKF